MKEMKLSEHKNIEGKTEKDKAFKKLLSVLWKMQIGKGVEISNLYFYKTVESNEEYRFHALATDANTKFTRGWYVRMVTALATDFNLSNSQKIEEENISIIIQHYDNQKPEIIFIVSKNPTAETKIYVVDKDGNQTEYNKEELWEYSTAIQKRYSTGFMLLKLADFFVSPKIFWENETVFDTQEKIKDKKPSPKTWLYVAIIVLAVIIFYKIKS